MGATSNTRQPESPTPGDVIRGCIARCEPCSYRRVSGGGMCDDCRRALKLAEAVDRISDLLILADFQRIGVDREAARAALTKLQEACK